jgi:hypothetical protein
MISNQCSTFSFTSPFHNGGEIAVPPLQKWADNTLTEKKSFFVMMSEPPLTSQFGSFGLWVVSMQTMFRDGFSSRTKYLAERSVVGLETASSYFEDETLGGFVSFDKFQAILDTSCLLPFDIINFI